MFKLPTQSSHTIANPLFCHLEQSVQKLLSRIVAPSHLDLPIHPGDEPEQAPPRRTKSGSLELMQQRRRSSGDASLSFGSSHHQVKDLDSHLHDHTYGITSDPLTQFVCVLSAMIHGTCRLILCFAVNAPSTHYFVKNRRWPHWCCEYSIDGREPSHGKALQESKRGRTKLISDFLGLADG